MDPPVAEEVEPYKSLLELLHGVERLLPESPRDRGVSGENLSENHASAYSEARKAFIKTSKRFRERLVAFKKDAKNQESASSLCETYELDTDFAPSRSMVAITGKTVALTRELLQHLPDLKVVQPNHNLLLSNAANVKTALEEFVKVGKLLRESSGFGQTIVKKLQDSLVGFEDTVKRVLVETRANPEAYSDDYTFVALAGPSLVGKTQSAFTFNDEELKPVYFALADHQDLYMHFSHWKQALTDALNEDLNTLRAAGYDVNKKETLTADKILGSYAEIKFRVIGLILAIIQDAKENIGTIKSDGWMKYFAERQNLGYEKATWGELKAELGKCGCGLFVLFLDEFKEEFIFVRNLARAAGMRCVVANTNSKVTNLVGPNGISRRDKSVVWSLVTTKLDPASRQVLDKMFELNDSLEIIKNSFADGSSLVEWFEKQIATTRPGIAALFAMAAGRVARARKIVLRQLVEDESERAVDVLDNFVGGFNRVEIMDFMLTYVARYLLFRKREIDTTIGHCANLALLVSQAYNKNVSIYDTRPGVVNLFNHINALEKHLYYLCNPSRPNDWKYLAILEESDQNTGMTHIGLDGQREEMVNFTHFRCEERFTILACLFLKFKTSMFALAQDASLGNINPTTFFNRQSENAPFFSGNYLENLASVVACAASHCVWDPSDNNMRFSIAPKTGVVFIHNFIRHLRAKLDVFTWNQTSSVLENNFKLFKFLEKCRIPFIYGIDRQDAKFEELDMQSYTRAPNGMQIDGYFDMYFGKHRRRVSLECKNRRSPVSCQELMKCVTKAKDYPLSIILATKVVEVPKSATKLAALCRGMKMNLLRYTPEEGKSFRFESFGGVDIFAKPAKVCLIIETKKVHPSLNTNPSGQKRKRR